jgi:hypothetical protein
MSGQISTFGSAMPVPRSSRRFYDKVSSETGAAANNFISWSNEGKPAFGMGGMLLMHARSLIDPITRITTVN